MDQHIDTLFFFDCLGIGPCESKPP